MTQRHPHSTAHGRSPSKTVAVPHIPLPAADRANASQADPPALTFSVSVSASQHLIIKVLRRPVEFNLGATVAVVHQSAPIAHRAVIERLVEDVQGKLGVQRPRDAPAHDTVRIGIDDKGNVDEATPS